jgi:hypothetical protein
VDCGTQHGVRFAISGIQNPERARLRDRAVALGAVYHANVAADTTHLVGPLADTPKHHALQRLSTAWLCIGACVDADASWTVARRPGSMRRRAGLGGRVQRGTRARGRRQVRRGGGCRCSTQIC